MEVQRIGQAAARAIGRMEVWFAWREAGWRLPPRGGAVSSLITDIALLAVVTLASCAQAPAHMLPQGWTWHHDTTLPIAVPVPPDWRANAYWADWFQGSHCAYAVDLIPPVSEQLYAESPPGGREPELIQALIAEGSALGCASAPSVPEGMALQPQTLTISGAPAKLYAGSGLQNHGVGLHEVAITHFGAYQYDLNFEYDYRAETPSDKGQEQLAVYMQVLRSFEYTGK